ncbi:MAG: hypothetical protein ABR555_16515 [Pyrinomonadaceae bacterium]
MTFGQPECGNAHAAIDKHVGNSADSQSFSPFTTTPKLENTHPAASDGDRTELRQVGASALYESADSAHVLLDAGSMTLKTTDGTQLSYTALSNDYECTKVKDRNGNYLTVRTHITTSIQFSTR